MLGEATGKSRWKGWVQEAPNTKHQAPEKHQTPTSKPVQESIKQASWDLKIGAYLELGGWNLEFCGWAITSLGRLVLTAEDYAAYCASSAAHSTAAREAS